ncbi:hypothetical protein KJ359_002112 [Pestalotiopsis sp. 9143b]|nr:hypothetical protein KJ359_002112 [Pestalotiopsis sp. 9143b]
MYAQWARASRSAALRAPTVRLSTRPAGPGFHSSAPVREAATDASNPSPNPTPSPSDESPNGSSGDKPRDDESGTASQDNAKEEDLFGDKGLSNGDVRGRARRSSGALKTRATKQKTSDSLPPVHLPEDFSKYRVFRGEDARREARRGSPVEDSTSTLMETAEGFVDLIEEWVADVAECLEEITRRQDQTEGVHGSRRPFPDLDANSQAATALAWAQDNMKSLAPDEDMHKFDEAWGDIISLVHWISSDMASANQFTKAKVQKTAAKRPDWLAEELEFASVRGTALLVAACNTVLSSVVEMLSDPSVSKWRLARTARKLQDLIKSQDPAETAKAYQVAQYSAQRLRPYNLSSIERMPHILRILVSKLPHRPELGIGHYEAVFEATASIRADLKMVPPKYIRAADIKRPVTVLNIGYYSGSRWPRDIMRDIAIELSADMVHIHASDLAFVAGRYLGQDPILAPGPLSLLGYKAAENAGRLQRRKAELSEDDSRSDIPFSIVMHAEKPKKEGKKNIMDYFLGEPNRGNKNDEMWNDLKVNAVLEQFVLAADSEASQNRPLIVHIHDFNALNMDDECGAVIMGKLRKIVDDMWIGGRKVVLVGTCSSLDIPSAYKTALRELRTTERVIDINKSPSPDGAALSFISGRRPARDLSRTLKAMRMKEFRSENTKNIHLMIQNLMQNNDEDDNAGRLYPVDFDLKDMSSKHYPESLLEKLLPVSEVYRIAKTMLGFNDNVMSFNQVNFENVIRHVKNMDETQAHHELPEKVAEETKRNTMGDSSRPSTDYEKRFLSALVDPKDLRTTFNDIHAPRETIDSIKMLTQLSLLRPEAFAYGVLATDRIPGCLLYGPPGTGKTLLAKAVAKESGANMIEVSGASINQMYVGESEKNIRALFSMAKKKEPLVIFIDEADALLGARGGRNDAAGRRDVINQFLREWDGMEASKAFIMVATNRPFDLDEAVLRRLPRKLLVDLPLEADRAAILKIHLKNEAIDDTVSIEKIAKRTTLYSGSDLKNVCVAAAMAAVKEELEASEKHAGPEPYSWPAKRVLNNRHFEKALSEIPASVSEDMATLTAIKKFDERYGEKKTRRKRRGMGFEVVPEATDSHEARVRNPDN